MARIAIVPARGGSKRIARKNVRPFAGRPMIAHALAAARDAGVFERIVVSTDDDEIAEVAVREGAEVPFRRSADLSDDAAATVPVIADALRRLGCPPTDPVCCLYPGVPLLEPIDLARGLAVLEAGGCDYVFPVTAFESAVQRALRRGADGRTQPMYPQHAGTRTQDLEPAFHDAGQFYWGRAAVWLAGGHPHERARTILLPRSRVVDIDTPDDWIVAEALFEARRAAPPQSGLALRPVRMEDAALLLAWRNDPATRAASGDGDPVMPADHCAWLARLLADSDRSAWIAIRGLEPVGTVRAELDRSLGETTLSWTVAPGWRGCGIGAAMVRAVTARLPGRLRADVKADNAASARVARLAGFELVGEVPGTLRFARPERAPSGEASESAV
jgi:pseudaminic acid cytidylyltransferase